MAVGDRHAPTVDSTYSSPGYVSQHPWDHVEGAPYGTRGGSVVEHVFPADAEYIFEVDLVSGSNARFEDIDISIDGERVALIEYETGPAGGAYRRPITSGEVDRLMPLYEKGAGRAGGAGQAGGFEAGVRNTLEAILASPYFIFRMEKEPELAKPGGTYRVADTDLASRLSFFL